MFKQLNNKITFSPHLWVRCHLTTLPKVALTTKTRSALSIIEIMLSLVVFAILLSAVGSTWMTLREVQKLTQEEMKVHELAQTLSERIVGANWDWIGRDRPDETKIVVYQDESTTPATEKTVEVTDRYWRRYAWSWHRREHKAFGRTTVRLPPLTDHDWTAEDYAAFKKDSLGPLTTVDYNHLDMSLPAEKRLNPHNLVDLGILNERTGIENLQVYVEYYHASMLDSLFTQDLATKTVPYWKEVVAGKINEPFIFPESPFADESPELQMNTSDSAVALQAMVVRILVYWGQTPKLHRHQLVFARRK